jgi:hypothetical protein
MIPSIRRLAALLMLAAGVCTLTPSLALACACGCGVFDVGTSSLFPSGSGGVAFVEYDFMDQNRNRSGANTAPAADNGDKEIKTDFVTFGAQYMFNHQWGVMAEVPVWHRQFATENDAGTGVDTFNHTAIGDIRLRGMYTGFSHDMSTGLTFGLKLPTGDWKYANFDRDTEIGTGSTDLLLGAFHRGALTKDNNFSYFVQGQFDLPVASQGGYTPGDEFDGAVGVHYNGLTLANGKVSIAPIAQMLVSWRASDSGPNANPTASGYDRLIFSPGVEVAMGNWALYGDVELPIYQYYVGDQLAAPYAVKVILSHAF